MNKIKDKVKKYFVQFKQYSFTFGVIYLLTILFAFTVDSDLFDYEIFTSFLVFLGFLSLFYLLVESKYKDKKKNKYLLLSIIPSFIIGLMVYIVSVFNKSETFLLYFEFVLLFIVIISGLYFIYNVYKTGKDGFEKYLKNVIFNIIEVMFIYLILVIGISLLLLLFSFLIYNIDNIFYRFQILLFGLYLVPSLILSFKIEDNKSEFLSSIFTKVLFILMLIAFVIIYVYIFKLIFTNTLLENSIFYILSFLFVLSLPVWIVNGVIKSKINKINKFVPFAFIPFIILQIIAIIIRINDYGITEARYLGVMLVLFEIIYMIIYIFKIKLEKIIYAIVAISFITFICPLLNLISVSNNSQLNRILDIYEKNDHSEKDLKAIAVIYDRFNYEGYSREYLEKKVDQEVVEDLDKIHDKYRYSYDVYNAERNKYKYFYWNNNDVFASFDVSGFKKVEIIDNSQICGTDDYIHKEVVDKEKVNIGNYKVDLRKVFNNMVKDRNYLDDNYIINVDFNTRLIITQLSFSYLEKYDQVSNLRIKGYLLTK